MSMVVVMSSSGVPPSAMRAASSAVMTPARCRSSAKARTRERAQVDQ